MSRKDERASKEMYEQRTAMLPFTIRQELVGKRFLVITEEGTRRTAKNQNLENYSWKQGYIRACSVKDIHDRELQVLVEFDGASWEYRQWIKIYEQTKAFFVEKNIIWAARVSHGNNAHRGAISWPALIFVPLVDYLGLDKDTKHAVEYFGDKQLVFLKENEFELFKDNEENRKKVICLNNLVQEEFLVWQRLQKTQACLMTGTETLTGARVTVYRLELRQWYTGCITSHNLITRELHVMDDNVLQTHPEHPALVQIKLMADDDELHRLLLGEQTKMLPTRRQRNSQMYFQSGCPSEQKSHGGIATNWHMFHDCHPKPGWSHQSVVHAVNSGKPAFVPNVGNDMDSQKERSPQSLPSPNDSVLSKKETSNEKTCDNHSTSTFKVHKPIPLVAKPSNPALLPRYSPQPPRPSTSPLLSSLNNTPSPLGPQLSASPVSGQHTPSPQSLRNQSSPKSTRKESPFNISLCDQSTARAAAQKEITRVRNHENHRSNFQSMSSRKSNVTKTPEKDKQNSKLVDIPSVSSSNKNTEKRNRASLNPEKETIRETSPLTTTRRSPIGENSAKRVSPESEQRSSILEENTRNFVPGAETHRKKKTSATTKTATIGIVSHPAVVIADTSISPERSYSSRVEIERNEHASLQNVDTNPVTTQTENTPPRRTQYNGTQGCEHLRTIAQIQLEYLIFLEALVRFQHNMVVEAVHTINQTTTKEQFCYVSDFFCKLVESNRHTENLFREASITKQDRQKTEHQRHLSQETATSPNRVYDCLPEEIKTKLRSAQEAVNRERDEVLSVLLPIEEWEQRQGQQTEWEALKQHLQKHPNALYNENIPKPYPGEERTQPSRPSVPESQKLNTLQGQQQHQDLAKHQDLSWLDVSNEMRKIEQQRKNLRAPEEQQQTNRQIQSSPTGVIKMMQSPNAFLQRQAGGTDLLRVSQHFSLPQREQQNHEEVQKKMVNELFQMKDMEQKTILLQHIVQQLQSQKESSRTGLKSPPPISHKFGSGTTDNQLAKIQNNQSSFETNKLQIQPHVSKPAILSYPSPDQLLCTLSTSAVRRVTDNLQMAPGIISDQQSVTPSRNSDKCSPELVVGKELSTSGSTSILVDAISGEDKTGRKKDDTGSVRTSTEKSSTNKRKPPSVSTIGDSEIQPKSKRQRKSTKKNSSDIVSQDNLSSDIPPDSLSGKQVPVKSFPPGEVKPVGLISSDRNVSPVRANSEQFSAVQYQPRSITKGIGFVPFTSDTTSKPSVTSSVGDSLDVLATVSASLRTNKSAQNMQRSKSLTIRNLLQSHTGNSQLHRESNQPLADGNRQLSDDSTSDKIRELMKRSRQGTPTTIDYNRRSSDQGTNSPNKSKDSILGTDKMPMSADRIQEAEASLRPYRRSSADQEQTFEGKKSTSECNQSITQAIISDAKDINTSHALSGSLVIDKYEDVPDQSPANLVEFVKKTSVGVINSAGLNLAVNKTKKSKKDRPKKEKKSKTHSSKDKTSSKTDPLTIDSNIIAGDMSFHQDGEQTIPGRKPVESFSVVDNERPSKQTVKETVTISFDYDGQNRDGVIKKSDIEMQEATEHVQRSPLKHIVSDILKNTDDLYKQSIVKEAQADSKPVHLTYPEFNGNTLISDNSTDETLTQTEKHKNKEISGKISVVKKEKKSETDGGKTKKSSEKKSKTSRSNKKDKEIDRKSTKKSSKLNSDKVVSKSKDIKQSHVESTDVIYESNKINGKTPAVSKNGKLSDEQETNTEKLVVNKKKTSENKSSKSIDSSKESSSVSQNSKLDSSKEAVSSKEEHNVKEGRNVCEKKPRKKSDTSKAHTKNSAGEYGKKKSSKDEKVSKHNRKADKKSDKDNQTSSESNTKLQEMAKKEACVSAQDSTMTGEEFLSNVIYENEQKILMNEQEKTNKEADGAVKETLITTANNLNEENEIEKGEDSKNIVFVNDQSVASFVKGPEEGDSIVNESRKRKRCKSPQRDDSAVPDSNGVESSSETRGSESGQASTKKQSEKKENKARKKKVKKEDDVKSENDVKMETDVSASAQSVKQEDKEDTLSDAKKKVKKTKDPKEKKVKEKVCKEEWTYFLQRGGCKALPSMSQCRECRNYDTEEEAVLNKSCCRFDMFRRCRSKSNKLEMAGFSSSDNAQGDDLLPWIAGKEICKLLSLEVSKYILLNVGDEFCNLVKKEKEAFSWETKKETVAWKRAVRGIREMCDACATTIFNVHWVCPKCGFGVCLDCYKNKLDSSVASAEAGRSKRFLWVRCSVNTSHRPKRLVLTHIIPKQTLNEIGEQLHEAREFWGIGENCPCKRKDMEVDERIQELSNEEKDVIVDVVGTSLEEGKVEESQSQDQNLGVGPMETESAKESEKEPEVKTTCKDTNEEVSDETTDKLSENTEDTLPECKPKEMSEVKVEKTNEGEKSLDSNRQSEDNKSFLEQKLSECKSNELSSSNDKPSTLENDQKSSNETSQPLQCEEKESSKSASFVETNCDVTIAGTGIGALSLLMDYQSPVSSPAASPVKEMEFEESVDLTLAEEALLSRPSATQGESSEMTSTSSETVVESPMNIDTPSGEERESSAKMEESSPTTEVSSPMVGTISTVEDISTRVEARITDEIPAPHSWICRRPMLRLHQSHHDGNLVAFQSRWEKGEPILVSGVHENMTSHLWTPEGFENEFGTEKADVVNCKTGGTLEKMDIGTFWRGFESVKDRPLDNKGEPTLLKLKDWPPEADFVEKMPKRFNDLMAALPLPEYTSREGTRNLVSRLPDFFVKPDLGPKMYNAYGNAAFPSAGTTNLHIDMSDAVNVMVYVGVPFDKEYGEQERRDSLACIGVACDETQQYRARNGTEKLGALWHIFAAEDANKIRALFHKVCREKNMKYPASHDPIHDQCFYLDEPLLKRLKDEYGVVGWPIAQFLGDAIFIPAGAPHQVRNLHSCVKAAEDFVSPEHVGHCFKLTEEFRHLSEKHTNHEDKLQVKNIIYHAVKDAVSVLRQHEKTTSQTEETGNENV